MLKRGSMKIKILMGLSLLLLVAGKGFSQQIDLRDEFNAGVKAGLNRANIFDTQGENFVAERKYGFAGGAFLQIPFGSFLGLQPEVLYSQKGFNATVTNAGRTYEYTRSLNYIDVPLLLQVKPVESFYFLAGPQYSYLIGHRERFRSGNSTVDEQNRIRGQRLRTNTLSATAGFDVNIDNFVISGRAGWELLQNLGAGTSISPRYRNAWVQGTVGLRFR